MLTQFEMQICCDALDDYILKNNAFIAKHAGMPEVAKALQSCTDTAIRALNKLKQEIEPCNRVNTESS